MSDISKKGVDGDLGGGVLTQLKSKNGKQAGENGSARHRRNMMEQESGSCG